MAGYKNHFLSWTYLYLRHKIFWICKNACTTAERQSWKTEIVANRSIIFVHGMFCSVNITNQQLIFGVAVSLKSKSCSPHLLIRTLLFNYQKLSVIRKNFSMEKFVSIFQVLFFKRKKTLLYFCISYFSSSGVFWVFFSHFEKSEIKVDCFSLFLNLMELKPMLRYSNLIWKIEW